MHLCIVNLVIGTLYCSKGNIEFGVRLVMRAIDPVVETLGTDTWLYAKRCLISLIEKILTQTTIQPLNDEIFGELMIFLDAVSAVGKSITSAVINNMNNQLEKSLNSSQSLSSFNDENVADNNQSINRAEECRRKEVQTVSEEAQIIRKIFIKVNEQKTA